ncbi:hypothetical protein [Glaciecola punicea]|nr:hypothetical protein [Glaciecola punicea]
MQIIRSVSVVALVLLATLSCSASKNSSDDKSKRLHYSLELSAHKLEP